MLKDAHEVAQPVYDAAFGYNMADSMNMFTPAQTYVLLFSGRMVLFSRLLVWVWW